MQIRLGLSHMVLACVLFSLMGICVQASQLLDPAMPAPVTSFWRSLVNLLVLWGPWFSVRRLQQLFGDGRKALWLRGLFGGTALMLSFASIQKIGLGESSFIHSSNGLFIALLAPWLLGQRNSWGAWLAIAGALAGLGLLLQPRFDGGDVDGRLMALFSGLFTALAYLMVARSGRSNRPDTVVFYFCLVSVLLHLAYFAWAGWYWPGQREIWVLLGFSGVLASAAQYSLTRAYQLAPANLNAAVNYLVPVLNLGWSVLLFAKVPDASALLGCGLILVCGVCLPLLQARRMRAPARSAAQR